MILKMFYEAYAIFNLTFLFDKAQRIEAQRRW
jgi:hypothetical protein